VPVRREHDVRDLLALLRDRQPLLSQVSKEEVRECHAALWVP
jgi:hypothetical protein